MCNRKGCNKNNFPLKLIPAKVEEWDDTAAMEYNKGLIQRLLTKIDWPVFV